MHALLKTTTAGAALAAALSVSPLPLLAQDVAVDDVVVPDAAADPAATGETLAQDGATSPANGGTAAGDALIAEDGTTAEGATTDGTATELAQEGTAADGAATDDPGTQTAQEGTAGGTAAEDATQTAGAQAATGLTPQVTADAGAVANPPEQPNEQMQAVLDKLDELGAPPIGTVSVEEQRAAPTPADAVMALMEEQGIEPPAELAAIATRDITYPAADGSEQPARVYTPEGEGPFPLVVYFHGGGWVIADIDTYDASARALAAGAEAVVVSVEYRHAPENPFPAAHEDANAAFDWIVENSGSLNADSERLAVAGESAGGNLAFNVAVHARDAQLTPIDHMLLVYPVANDEMTTPSYEAYADAQPLSREGMMWFVENVFEDPAQAADPRIDIIERDDLAGLPPATIINAEIDPLQSEGEILAENLAAAGVEVSQMTYGGVAHEFFGMGAVVPQAQEAVDMATAALRTAFGGDAGAATADATSGEVTDVETTAAEGADANVTVDPATEAGATPELDSTAEPAEGDAASDQ